MKAASVKNSCKYARQKEEPTRFRSMSNPDLWCAFVKNCGVAPKHPNQALSAWPNQAPSDWPQGFSGVQASLGLLLAHALSWVACAWQAIYICWHILHEYMIRLYHVIICNMIQPSPYIADRLALRLSVCYWLRLQELILSSRVQQLSDCRPSCPHSHAQSCLSVTAWKQ